MYDHLSLGVAELERTATFYAAALAPLGYVQLWKVHRAVGFGPPGFTGEAPLAFLRVESGAVVGAAFHLAFRASERAAVDAFYAAAIAHGGTDDGPPAIRAHYDAGYYAAFVKDPDGHRLEAVVHERNAA